MEDGLSIKNVFVSLLAWLTFHNRNLSWDNLKRRGWQGPGICFLCWAEDESNFHLFFACKMTQPLWRCLEVEHGILSPSFSSVGLGWRGFLLGLLPKKGWEGYHYHFALVHMAFAEQSCVRTAGLSVSDDFIFHCCHI